MIIFVMHHLNIEMRIELIEQNIMLKQNIQIFFGVFIEYPYNKDGIWSDYVLSSSYAILIFRDIY